MILNCNQSGVNIRFRNIRFLPYVFFIFNFLEFLPVQSFTFGAYWSSRNISLVFVHLETGVAQQIIEPVRLLKFSIIFFLNRLLDRSLWRGTRESDSRIPYWFSRVIPALGQSNTREIYSELQLAASFDSLLMRKIQAKWSTKRFCKSMKASALCFRLCYFEISYQNLH